MATKVSLSQVVEALEVTSDEMSWFVHKQTGQVVMVSHEVMRLAEDDAEADLPDWQEEELRVARDVLESTDWLGLPSKFDVHEWEIMNRFAQSVAVPAQREEVLDAIHGSGAFRQFKSTIRRLRLEDAWFSFRDSAFEEMAKSWLDDHSFEIDDDFQGGGRPTRR
jgi:Uncharacterised protein family (UPF0158)